MTSRTLGPRAAVRYGRGTRAITGWSRATVGMKVCKTASTTGTTCGTVKSVNATVNYPEGRLTGMISTDVCVRSGDSGGALYSGGKAVGIVSGASSTRCGTAGFRSWFNPVDEVLRAYRVTLL